MAIKFEKRDTRPSDTNKYYLNYANKGYNTCVIIDKTTGFVLPNCTGYCQGRMLESAKATGVNWKLPACNAEDWISKAKENGLTVGSEPTLGAVIVWSKGKEKNIADGAGHVAFVEALEADGTIHVSESGYNSYLFKVETIKAPYAREGYKFIGFVYPIVEFEEEVTSEAPASTTTVANRYKVKNADGVQVGAYTNKTNAINYAKRINGVVFDIVTNTQIYPSEAEKAKTEANTQHKEDFSKNTIPNRFKVVKDGVQVGAYTTYNYAVNYAKAVNGKVVDGTNNKSIYPQ